MLRQIAVLAAALCVALPIFGQKIAPSIQYAAQRGEKTDFLVVFQTQPDVQVPSTATSKSQKGAFVWQVLEETAVRTQARARSLCRNSQASVNTLHIVNALAIQGATPSLLYALSDLPEVAWIGDDPWIHFEVAANTPPTTAVERGAIEWGVQRVQAPALWQMGYTGKGITVGGADTGYDWLHPALRRQYRGDATNHNYAWHDAIHIKSPLNSDTLNPCGFDIRRPCDDHNHGTHTAGTMVGDDGQGNQIGVAPGARWIGCRNMERGWGRPSTYLECFDWFLAPTDTLNRNRRPDLAPHVINNSWACVAEEGCTDTIVNNLLRQAVINLRKAGILVVVSNGNEGNQCASTFNAPAYFEESFSVGATRADNVIARFSSRGPVRIDGSNRPKPNVAAPGADVRSSIRGGGYANYSGTSMAGPHVAGVAALLMSARPDLIGQVERIETVLERSAVFTADTVDCLPGTVRTARPNHAYGWGRVDALRALQHALGVSVAADAAMPFEAKVYPNPATDAIRLLTTPLDGTVRFTLYNAQGVRCAEQVTADVAAFTLSMHAMPAGMYVWVVQTPTQQARGWVVKQ